MKRMRLALTTAFAVMFVFVGLQLRTADAGIITSAKPFRRKASSKGALMSAWWGQQTRNFWEDTKLKRWKIYYAVIFSGRINDLEVTVELYDITTHSRFLEAFSLWLSKRGEGSITSTLKLPRTEDGKFRPNSRIEMRVISSSTKKVLAKTWFRIKGKVKKFSGKVSFTEDETKGLPSGSRTLKAKPEEPKLSPKASSECPAKGTARLMIWGCGSFL